jgi:hypothetical protein
MGRSYGLLSAQGKIFSPRRLRIFASTRRPLQVAIPAAGSHTGLPPARLCFLFVSFAWALVSVVRVCALASCCRCRCPSASRLSVLSSPLLFLWVGRAAGRETATQRSTAVRRQREQKERNKRQQEGRRQRGAGGGVHRPLPCQLLSACRRQWAYCLAPYWQGPSGHL